MLPTRALVSDPLTDVSSGGHLARSTTQSGSIHAQGGGRDLGQPDKRSGGGHLTQERGGADDPGWSSARVDAERDTTVDNGSWQRRISRRERRFVQSVYHLAALT